MLNVMGLRKRFGSVVALEDVSFRIAQGETVGLLGPNGAGKTTTVSIICGLLAPDCGQVLLDGQPLRGDTDPAKLKVGLVPQELALYDELTGLENLWFFGALYGLDPDVLAQAIGTALELVGLSERANDRVHTYSGGMKRRLNLAAALLHGPRLLILDEPTVGVDPQSRNAIFDNLNALRARGMSILYTTHYMEEAERLCDRIVIVDHGRVAADDTLHGLLNRLPASNRLLVELDDAIGRSRTDGLREVPGVVAIEVDDGRLAIAMTDFATVAPRALGWLAENGCAFHHLETDRADLQAVFLHLTGRSLRDS